MKSIWKHNCVNCHFFVQKKRFNNGNVFTSLINRDDRNKTLESDYSWRNDMCFIECDFNIWSEGHKLENNLFTTLVKKRRNNNCYFFKYSPEVSTSAARELQKRGAENKQSKIDKLWTIIGIIIAALLSVPVGIYLSKIVK